jgi:hypothetical protein
MTPQERQLLESLASRVAGTAIPQKDPEADALIRQKLGTMPDALYVLTQTVLIQEMALNQANGRLHELQEQIDAHRGEQNQPTSFLGRLFGSGPAARPAQGSYQQPPYQQSPYQQAPYQQGPPVYEQVPYQAAPSQGSSFLRSAAMTATGVAAGALAFEGIESLFGHHGGFGGNSFGGGEFLGGGGPSETIVNNYYDEPRGGEDSDRFASDTRQDDFQQDDSNVDTSDAGFNDSADNDSSDNSGDDFSSTDV